MADRQLLCEAPAHDGKTARLAPVRRVGAAQPPPHGFPRCARGREERAQPRAQGHVRRDGHQGPPDRRPQAQGRLPPGCHRAMFQPLRGVRPRRPRDIRLRQAGCPRGRRLWCGLAQAGGRGHREPLCRHRPLRGWAGAQKVAIRRAPLRPQVAQDSAGRPSAGRGTGRKRHRGLVPCASGMVAPSVCALIQDTFGLAQDVRLPLWRRF
mmetsp:Transcript_70721/g.199696  ORF Transcript_70721/g.199696 Transcript_70721/m.199696 type:complete len:209 (-) Transcript_70721:457-1083(-)